MLQKRYEAGALLRRQLKSVCSCGLSPTCEPVFPRIQAQ